MKTTLYLIVSGVVLSLVGLYIAGSTAEYFAVMMAADARPSTSMASDLRGMGGLLLVLGGYVLLGAFRKVAQRTALTMATLVFATFVAFRSLGMVLDGLPDAAVMGAYLIEALLLLLGMALLMGREDTADALAAEAAPAR